jgi:undecaprenyl-diphosphatase
LEYLNREGDQKLSTILPLRMRLILLGVMMALAVIDTVLAKSSFILPFNRAVFSMVYGLRLELPWLTNPMILVTLFGSDPVLLAFVVVLVLRYRRIWGSREATVFMLAAIIGRITVTVAKALVQLPRPSLIEPPPPFYFSGYGYPSGHALLSMVVLGGAALLAIRHGKTAAGRRIAVAVCVSLILAIGVSRVYLGAHWANDVVGGYLYGICILLVAELARKIWINR